MGKEREGKSKQAHVGLPEKAGEEKIPALALLGPLMRVGLCQRGSPCAKVSGNKEVGLGRTSVLQVNLLFLREILAVVLRPTFSAIFHPNSHSLPISCTHPLGYLPILHCHSSGASLPPPEVWMKSCCGDQVKRPLGGQLSFCGPAHFSKLGLGKGKKN